MIVITSAAYVNDALASEFGRIPPAMLPVQNRRLYEHQLELIGSDQDIAISFPESYIIPKYDRFFLESRGVTIVTVPDVLSLGESVLFVLDRLHAEGEAVILHGDTLFSALPARSDYYSVSEPSDYYRWSSPIDNDSSVIYTGCFAFSIIEDLMEDLRSNNGDFIVSIESYKSQHNVIDINLEGWLDFGLINTYYRSCSKMTTQRVFNSLEVTKYSVCKSSHDVNKMFAEANWIQTIPYEMKHYVPCLWDKGTVNDRAYYVIEYLYLSSLANIFVFGENSIFVWKQILRSCFEFIEQEFNVKPIHTEPVANTNLKLFINKTRERLTCYCNDAGISMSESWVVNGKRIPSLNVILDELFSHFKNADERFVSLMHGDFCFSNILYDFKSQTIKVIDPRGEDAEGTISVYGDVRYDVAKLAHSVIGMYDYIIAGRFEYHEENDYCIRFIVHSDIKIEELQKFFMDYELCSYTMTELSVFPTTILLFLSMLPLHRDNSLRQKALLANALRLYLVMINQRSVC